MLSPKNEKAAFQDRCQSFFVHWSLLLLIDSWPAAAAAAGELTSQWICGQCGRHFWRILSTLIANTTNEHFHVPNSPPNANSSFKFSYAGHSPSNTGKLFGRTGRSLSLFGSYSNNNNDHVGCNEKLFWGFQQQKSIWSATNKSHIAATSVFSLGWVWS